MAIILIFIPPVSSGDVYQYTLHGKIVNYYNQNPYLTVPKTLGDEALLLKIPNLEMAAIYGPLWTVLTIIYNFLSQQNVFINIVLLKFNSLIFIYNSFSFIYS